MRQDAASSIEDPKLRGRPSGIGLHPVPNQRRKRALGRTVAPDLGAMSCTISRGAQASATARVGRAMAQAVASTTAAKRGIGLDTHDGR
jgi:hypothetical protein